MSPRTYKFSKYCSNPIFVNLNIPIRYMKLYIVSNSKHALIINYAKLVMPLT